MASLRFLGSGDFFNSKYQNSNALFTIGEKKFLIDAGFTIQTTLKEQAGIAPPDLDAVYISHPHADHMGGLEFLTFNLMFMNADKKRPTLYIPERYLPGILTAVGGITEKCVGSIVRFEDVWNIVPVASGQPFHFGGATITPLEVPHIVSPKGGISSFGLRIETGKSRVWFSTDCCLRDCKPEAPVWKELKRADLIFHEWTMFKHGPHTSMVDLMCLDSKIREKIWLYHSPTVDHDLEDIHRRGFRGVVPPGGFFVFPTK